jgi:MoaA/NifB/PqqE/SkfB family radical SAM enzyme
MFKMLKIQTNNETFCTLPFSRIRITSEGNVGFCCIHKPIVGNILEKSFDEIWNGPLAEEVREVTKRNKLHSSCAGRYCPYEFGPRQYSSIVKHEYPIRIDLDLPNTHCNIGGTNPSIDSPACIMCPRSSVYFQPEEDKVLQICEKIKPYLAYVNNLHIQGIAEPFWKGKLFETLDALEFEKHKNRIEFSTFTNGTIFSKKVREEYLKRCPKSVTYISMDAATDATYRKIRIVDSFKKMQENFIAFGKERGTSNKLVSANNINAFNVSEIASMIDLAKLANVDWIEFNSTDANDENMLKFVINEDNQHLFKNAEKIIENKCKELNISYKILKSLETPIKSIVNFFELKTT